MRLLKMIRGLVIVFGCVALFIYLYFKIYPNTFHILNPLPATDSVVVIDEAKELLDTMTLEEKVGQLFMLGHWNKDDIAITLGRINEIQAGGVIFMDVPIEPSTTLPALTAALQASSSLPLLIGIDQEGGTVTRLKGSKFVQTSQPEITAASQAYEVGLRRASEMAALGINLNFAPVLEVSVKPNSFLYNRVFRDPAQIPTLATALIAGSSAGGVLSGAKHYPGHADTPDDSHLLLPILTLSVTEYETHTKPFSDTLALGDVPLLMTAHVLIPALDDTYPATLSPAIIADLRERVGYQGVIITDDMIMNGITNKWTSSEASVLALKAGVDILLFAAEPGATEAAYRAVLGAVRTGDLPEERLDEAVLRILRTKENI